MGKRRGAQAVLGAIRRGSMPQTAIDAQGLNLSPNQDKSSFWSQDEEKDARNAAA